MGRPSSSPSGSRAHGRRHVLAGITLPSTGRTGGKYAARRSSRRKIRYGAASAWSSASRPRRPQIAFHTPDRRLVGSGRETTERAEGDIVESRLRPSRTPRSEWGLRAPGVSVRPGVDIEIVLRSHRLPPRSEPLREDSERFGASEGDARRPGLREHRIVTIDGETARTSTTRWRSI